MRAVLKCVDCGGKTILEAEVGQDFRPDRSTVMNNMKCALANHKLRVDVK